MNTPLLSLRELTLHRGERCLLDRISFDIEAGTTLGLVGESGSGKSQTALAIMGLLDASARIGGQILFDGQDLQRLPSASRRALRGSRMAMVFQDPMASLNPYLRIGVQLAEVLQTHRGATRAAAWAEAARTLEAVRLSAPRQRLDQYPHELSGGMRQRVMIAMAIIAEPQLLIADEPTTALDPTVQLAMLDLLAALQRERQLAILLITHDLGIVAQLCERTLVMRSGVIVESGPTSELLASPQQAYTRHLLDARPRADRPRQPRRASPIKP